MENNNSTRPDDSQDGGNSGWILVLIFILGLPLLGILAKLLGY